MLYHSAPMSLQVARALPFCLVSLLCGCGGPAESPSAPRCDRPDQCPEGQLCDQGGCVDPLPENATCERHSQCQSGQCIQTSESGDRKICD